MSSRIQHTIADAWSRDILPRLPADLDHYACSLKAFQRRRAFASPSDLLRGLLVYALDKPSLAQLGIWGVLSGVADIAPSSWFERLQASKDWLRWLVARLLASPLRSRWLSQRVRGRVLLVDATTLGLAHGPGDAYRLHLAYNLLCGQFDHLHLSDRSSAEHLQHFPFQKGDIAVADSGYGHIADIAYAHQHGAAVALRVYLPTLPLQHRDGRRFDLLGWLHRVGPTTTTLTATAQVVHQNQAIAVRVIAARLPRDKQGAALRRAGERARRKGRALTPVSALLATWWVVVTTLDANSWSPADVMALYRLRWQVEVRIKHLKQLVTGSRLASRTAASGEALLWAQLVGWALHEPTAESLRARVVASGGARPTPQARAGEASRWQLSVVVVDTLRQAVRGTWDEARLKACLPRLRRYVVRPQRRERVQQESAGRAWLEGVGPMPEPGRPRVHTSRSGYG